MQCWKPGLCWRVKHSARAWLYQNSLQSNKRPDWLSIGLFFAYAISSLTWSYRGMTMEICSATRQGHWWLVVTSACLMGMPLLASAEVSFRYDLPAISPEAASGYTEKPGWATQRFAVAAANPLATDAGYQVLQAGGSAIDAAIAVQMVLTLVEPQSSGIGGGAFLLHHDGSTVRAYDGRETAPRAASESLFFNGGEEPLEFMDAVASGLSVGVPGTVRMLELAHKEHGSLPWAELFAPAIALAEEGFEIR